MPKNSLDRSIINLYRALYETDVSNINIIVQTRHTYIVPGIYVKQLPGIYTQYSKNDKPITLKTCVDEYIL